MAAAAAAADAAGGGGGGGSTYPVADEPVGDIDIATVAVVLVRRCTGRDGERHHISTADQNESDVHGSWKCLLWIITIATKSGRVVIAVVAPKQDVEKRPPLDGL